MTSQDLLWNNLPNHVIEENQGPYWEIICRGHEKNLEGSLHTLNILFERRFEQLLNECGLTKYFVICDPDAMRRLQSMFVDIKIFACEGDQDEN
jgi:hypothetical protein